MFHNMENNTIAEKSSKMSGKETCNINKKGGNGKESTQQQEGAGREEPRGARRRLRLERKSYQKYYRECPPFSFGWLSIVDWLVREGRRLRGLELPDPIIGREDRIYGSTQAKASIKCTQNLSTG